MIDENVMENISILAKLELTKEEKARVKADMEEMLNYVGKLNELDTSQVEAVTHFYDGENVFREDLVVEGDGSVDLISSAPSVLEGSLVVPKTLV